MSSDLTQDEVRLEHIACMGGELGRRFNALQNECLWLHLKWKDYVALFGVSQSRIDILKASASGFFLLVVDSVLWRDVILHLCTLTDDPVVGRKRKPTLTIRGLPKLVDPAIRREVERLVSAAIKKTQFARDWRNRHIAHRDLDLAIQEDAKPLADASRKSVNDAITAIVSVLKVVESHYCTTTTGYEYVSHLGDAEMLLHVLRDSIEARNELIERLTAGLMSPSDFKPKPPI